MILIDKITIIVSPNKKKYYIDKGYNAKIGKELEINIFDLPNNSSINIDCSCDYCGKIFNRPWDYINPNRSIKCQAELKISCQNCQKLKNKEICNEKYGVDNVFQLENVKNKSKETLQKNYNVDNALKSEEIKEKVKNTCLKKYNANYVLQSKIIRKKIEQTCIKRYNVKHAIQNDDIRNKAKITCLQNYGVEYGLQSPIIQNKVKNSLLKKYGVDHP